MGDMEAVGAMVLMHCRMKPKSVFQKFQQTKHSNLMQSSSCFFCIPNHCWYCWEILLTLSKVFGFHFFRYSNHSKHGKHMKVMPWSWSAITRGIRGLTRYSMAHLVHCSEQEPLMIFMVWNDADEISDKEMRSARCTYLISNPRTVKLPHGYNLLKQYWGILGRGNTWQQADADADADDWNCSRPLRGSSCFRFWAAASNLHMIWCWMLVW
jgi:hypothetical protein